MKIIGLTGPTGAGKSVVSAAFTRAGALVVDTDGLAREVVRAGEPCLRALAAHFGDGILKEDGTLDRAALAAVAFASPAQTQALNDITHPFIIARSRDILQNSDAAVAVIDAPLLFESGMDALCDETIAVLSDRDSRLARIMRRDGIDEARARARMEAQPDDAFYLTRATHILHNNGDLAAFETVAAEAAHTYTAEVNG